MGLGARQRAMLGILADRGSWAEGDWTPFGTPQQTVVVLRSLRYWGMATQLGSTSRGQIVWTLQGQGYDWLILQAEADLRWVPEDSTHLERLEARVTQLRVLKGLAAESRQPVNWKGEAA